MTAPGTAAPGTALRQARTERGLSIDEVAQALRLSPRIISALEEEAYDRLPGPTYVRGYLRSYAQFLGLSARALIEAFNDRPEAHRRTEMTGPTAVRQATSSDVVVRLGSVVVGVIVLGLAALWWTGHEDTGLRFPPEQATFDPHVESDLPSEAAAPEVFEPAAPAEDARGEAPEELAPTAPAADTPAPEPSPVPAATLEPEPAPAPARAPDVAFARLVLYTHEDCWADVRDARGERLLYETVAAGRVVTVEGVAPLNVFLGNVQGVTVEFNGVQYNAIRHRRGEVARFTLGSGSG